jgi:NitT/TauT family transport system substrate-binding protein
VKKDVAKRTEAVAILASATKLDVALFDAMVMPGIDPTGKVNLDSIREIQAWFVAKGSQQKLIELSKAVDQSFADEAVRQLGPYK